MTNFQPLSPGSTTIAGPSNAYVRRIRSLRTPDGRRTLNRFVVEGILPVWRALENGTSVEALIVAPDLLTSVDARRMLEAQAEAGQRIVFVSSTVFTQIAERDRPSGLAAVVEPKRVELDALPVQANSVVTALHQPANPGNVGSIIRTVDATAGAGVVLIGGGTDECHPTAVKASMGTIFSTPIAHATDGWASVFTWARRLGIAIVGTSAHAEQDMWSAPLIVPAIIVLGNEGRGLPAEIRADCDQVLRIPMRGAGSLNLAVAASVVLYEYYRRGFLGAR